MWYNMGFWEIVIGAVVLGVAWFIGMFFGTILTMAIKVQCLRMRYRCPASGGVSFRHNLFSALISLGVYALFGFLVYKIYAPLLPYYCIGCSLGFLRSFFTTRYENYEDHMGESFRMAMTMKELWHERIPWWYRRYSKRSAAQFLREQEERRNMNRDK